MLYWARVALECPAWAEAAHQSTFVEADDQDAAIEAVEKKVRENMVVGLAVHNAERGTKVPPDQVTIKVLKLRDVEQR